MNYINKEGPRDHSYSASYKGDSMGIYARSEAAARQKAVEYWKLKKKQINELTIVVVHERDDLVFVS